MNVCHIHSGCCARCVKVSSNDEVIGSQSSGAGSRHGDRGGGCFRCGAYRHCVYRSVPSSSAHGTNLEVVGSSSGKSGDQPSGVGVSGAYGGGRGHAGRS